MPTFAAQIDTLRIPIKGLIPEQSASALATPVEGLTWHDTVNKHVFVWLNGAWQQLDNVAGGSTPAGPAGGELAGTYPNPTVADNVIDSANIINGTIQAGDLAGGVIPTTLPPSGAAGGDLTGSTYPNPVIATGAVTSAKIADGTIDTVDLKDSSVTSAKIVSLAVDSSKLADQAVSTVKLADFGVTNTKLANNSVDSFKIVDNSIQIQDLLTSGANSVRLDTVGAPTGPVSLNNQKLTSVTDPTNPQDAATKAYVDSVAQGLDPKQSVKAASTGNVNLANPSTLDGVAINAGDRVLLKNQTNLAENGIYVAAGGPLTYSRATDMDTWTEVPSAFTFVEQGTTQADTGWVCTSDQGGSMGGTNITWAQFSGVGTVTAGAGMTQAGNVLNVIAGDTSVTVAADDIRVNTAVIATVASPTLTGDPKAPTPTAGDNDTSIATTAFVTGAISTSAAGQVPSARTITAGAGLTGGGDLTADRTFNVVAGDTTLLVNPDDIRVQINSLGGMPSLQTGAGGMSVKHTNALADSSAGLTIAPNGVDNSMIADGAVNLASADVTGTLPVTKGGTGSTTPAAARTALGVPTILTAVVPALPTPGTYVTVPGISKAGGGPMGTLSVGFGFAPGGDTAASGAVFLDWKTRGVAEDFQVKADVVIPANTYNVTVVMAG